jgi:hypothetical protein
MGHKGTFLMPASDNRSSVHGYVADPPANPDVTRLRGAHIAATWQRAQHIPDAQETRLRRRARRQAVALMVASSVISILALYGIWTLLRGAI